MQWYEKMKILRKEKTIEEVANDLILSPSCYTAYESGQRMPLPVVKKYIAEYFNIMVEDIW